MLEWHDANTDLPDTSRWVLVKVSKRNKPYRVSRYLRGDSGLPDYSSAVVKSKWDGQSGVRMWADIDPPPSHDQR